MRDVTRRIQRYRLGRYGRNEPGLLRRWPWVWVLFGLWAVWAFVLSDHSLWRILRLRSENERSVNEVANVREEISRLEQAASDPRQSRQRAERWLREQGGMARPGEIIYRIQDGAPDTLPR